MTTSMLLSARDCAELLGISERKFKDLRKESWFPKPIALGERTIRWIRVEVEQALIQHAPRTDVLDHPESLK